MMRGMPRRPFALLLLAACDTGAIVVDDPTADTDPADAVDSDAVDPPADTDPVDTDPVDSDPVARADYDHDGPTTFTVERHTVRRGGGSYKVTVVLPDAPGPVPVVSLSCGSTQTAAGYLPHARRLASHGIATVLTDDPGALVKTVDVIPNAVHVVDTWLPATYGDRLDLQRVGLAGHSRGGAVSLLAAERGLKGKVVAWFGLDPVDAQFLLDAGAYARTDLGDVGIPTGFLGAEVESNCAPAADSWPMLWPLAPSPSVLVEGLGAGHTQLEDPSGCTLCDVCGPDGTADADVVLAYALRYLTAFFARELLGDAGVGAGFEGAGGPDDVAAGRVTITVR